MLVLHPGVPAAQGHCAEGDRRPESLGVDVQTNMVIGRVLSIDELPEQGYEAVFIGPARGCPGRTSPGELKASTLPTNF
ncbi:MAG: hypothetical protein ACLRSY_01825 [Acutalibacter sp.]